MLSDTVSHTLSNIDQLFEYPNHFLNTRIINQILTTSGYDKTNRKNAQKVDLDLLLHQTQYFDAIGLNQSVATTAS